MNISFPKKDRAEFWPTARFVDLRPSTESFRDAVIGGLGAAQKSLPSKFFYDERGSRLFDEICRLEEYYPTRTEMALMADIAPELRALVPEGAELVEFGSGSSQKVRILLDQVGHFDAYVSIDISADYLQAMTTALACDYPALDVLAVSADYTQPIDLAHWEICSRRRVGFFPGSTIGNLTPDGAVEFLENARSILGAGGGFIVGADLKKDVGILETAYNDAKGVTAEFNLNLLRRINSELGGDFDINAFRHRAHYNDEKGRIEMHLISERDQSVRVNGNAFEFAAGETIHTENSHKYTIEDFQEIAAQAGFAARKAWTDEKDLFSIHYLEVE